MDASKPVPILDLAPELAEIAPELDDAWRRVCSSGHFIGGPEVESFEREIASFLGSRHAVAVNSGTDALVLSLRAMGVGPGDEVVTSPFTFFATSESIDAVGATTVFADIDPVTYTIAPDRVREVISGRTKAILPVHLFGHAADMHSLNALAREKNLALLEDVAQAFGGRTQGRNLGTMGVAGAFSFFPSKNLGCMGDGGLVATDDDGLCDAVRMLRSHGSRSKYFNEAIGYNSRLDAIQAAVLRVKLTRVATWNAARRAAAKRYDDLLGSVDGIVVPAERPGVEHVYHQYTIRILDGRRDAVRAALASERIGSAIYYPKALHQLPVYADRKGVYPEAERAAREVLSLPFWPRIEPGVQERVARTVREALRRAGAGRGQA